MIYLDNNATTRPTARVVEAMLPYLTECYFNASALAASFTEADKPRREAAASMANLLNAEAQDCVVFTSGATESNNWVLSSLLKGKRRGRIVISSIEHSSIAEPAAELASAGFEVIEVPVDAQGVVHMDTLRGILGKDTALVSIMAANNETGVLEPIAEIGQLIRERCSSALFHTDATQAVGKIPIDLQGEWQDVDLVSFSAHKFYGPKGIGGLYVRPEITLEPLLRGGGQEGGLRAGTTNTAGLAGLAAAASEVDLSQTEQMRVLRNEFEKELLAVIPAATIHSVLVPRLQNTSCFSIPKTSGAELALRLSTKGIIVGTGSACSAGAIHPPRTLLAMGVDYDLAVGTIRVGFSKYSTESDGVCLIRHLLEVL